MEVGCIDPGSMASIDFTVSGLNKGDWKEAEVFYRGNGEVIGSEKIDEALLEEARKQERLQEVVEEFVVPSASTSSHQKDTVSLDSNIVSSEYGKLGTNCFEVMIMKERTRSKEDTIQALHAVAAEMHDRMMRGEPPRMTLPVRSKKNINFDERLNVYKYGKRKRLGMLPVLDLRISYSGPCSSQNLWKR